MKCLFLVLITIVLTSSCSEIVEEKESVKIEVKIEHVNLDSIRIVNERIAFDSSIQEIYQTHMLVDIQSVNSNIRVDLKYSTEDNFMHVQLYDTIRHAYLNADVAERLSLCQNLLDSLYPGFQLLVFDAVRPLSVQRKMWFSLDSIPYSRRGKFVSNPKYGSVHNYGAAVDLTIVDSNGLELDMGAGYDDFRPIAFPSREKEFLASGDLTITQFENRKLLRKVMRFQHFYNIPSEWWHFNAFSRVTTSNKLKCLMNESGDFDWFIVPVPKKDSITP